MLNAFLILTCVLSHVSVHFADIIMLILLLFRWLKHANIVTNQRLFTTNIIVNAWLIRMQIITFMLKLTIGKESGVATLSSSASSKFGRIRRHHHLLSHDTFNTELRVSQRQARLGCRICNQLVLVHVSQEIVAEENVPYEVDDVTWHVRYLTFPCWSDLADDALDVRIMEWPLSIE